MGFRLTKATQFSIVANVIFLLLSVYFSAVCLQLWNSDLPRGPVFFNSYALEGTCIVLAVCFSLMCRSIANSHPSDHVPHLKLFKTRLIFLLMGAAERKFYKAFTKTVSCDPEKAQHQWLMQFLKDRQGTALGKDFEFDQIKSVSDFTRKLPITEYDVYRGYAERAAAGEADVMSKGVADYIVLTSGTTGNNKMFPFYNANFKSYINFGVFLPAGALGDRFPSRRHLVPQLLVWMTPNIVKHETSGIRMGAFTGYLKLDHALMTTPLAAVQAKLDENVMMYLHVLFSILHQDVTSISFGFASTGRVFFLTLENRWRDMLEDIRTGTVNGHLNIPPELRRGLQKEMWADPARAAELETEFAKGFDNILPRIFPSVSMVVMVTSGTMQTPSLTLQRKYFRSVPVSSTVHAGSEGLYGVCLDPGDIQNNIYTVVPHQAFYEFIPLADVPLPNPEAKLMHQLELNEQYELCMTTDRGLFRYRTGDIIKVVSYFNKTPQYEFIGRYGQLLDVGGEKTSENAFNAALEDTVTKLTDFSLVDYTTAENRTLDTIQDAKDSARFYLLFIELEQRRPGVSTLTQDQIDMFDADLQDYNEGYKDLRSQGRIEKMKVIQVPAGAFIDLKKWILSKNAKTSSAQFKTPRVLRTEGQLQFMMETCSLN